MKKFLFVLISCVVLLFVGFTTYYILRNDEVVSYTVSDKETIYMNIGEKIQSPVIHDHKAPKSEVKVSLSNSNAVYDDKNGEFFASKVGSTTVTCVPSNTKFSAITFTIKIGDGSVNNPYFIRNENDLLKIGKGEFNFSSSYELVSNITLTKTFTPIGNKENAFLGNFFGGESMHTISNINIESNSSTAGFFGSIGSSAKIERVKFENISISGDYEFAGSIAGINNGFIGQCIVKNSLITNSKKTGVTGGIVGLNKTLGSNATISLCTYSGILNARNYVGGIIGKSEGGVAINNIITVDSNLLVRDSTFGGVTGFNTYSSYKIGEEDKLVNSKYVNNLTLLNSIGPLGNYYTIIGVSEVISSQPRTFTYYDMQLTCSSSKYSALGEHGSDYYLTTDSSSSIGYYKNLAPQELSSKDTFTSPQGSCWNFEEYWSVEEGKITIDYVLCAGSYQALPESASVKNELSSSAQVLNAINLMREYPNANLEFKITKNLLIDLNGAEISPIGNSSNPFVGKFTTADGVRVIIRNYTINSKEEYVGFFGAISGSDTLIKGIEFSNASYTGSCVGGIVGLNNGAIIENCKIDSFTMFADKIVGGMVAINKGKIVGGGANISGGYCAIEVNNISSNELAIGVVSGENHNIISQVEASLVKIIVYTESDKASYLGGLVGKQSSGEIDKSATYNINFKADNLNGVAYSGGLVGYLDGGVVKNSFISAYTSTLSFASDNAFSGGLVGFLGEKGEVESCLFDNGTITAKKVGGVAGVQYGNVNKCAVMTTAILEGYEVGGLIFDCHGSLRNSYSLATLKGSSIEAGFVVNLNINASVRYCYNYCAYTGDGVGYCETATSFRSDKANREFTKNIVVGINVGGGGFLGDTFVTKVIQRDAVKEIKIQTRFGYNKGSFVIVSQDIATGVSAFSEFSERGFDSNIWNIYSDIGEEKSYLSLKDLPVIPSEDDEQEEDDGENEGDEDNTDNGNGEADTEGNEEI